MYFQTVARERKDLLFYIEWLAYSQFEVPVESISS